MRMTITVLALTALLVAAGCLNLDFMLHNGIHCSKISDKTCKDKEEYWNKICLPCDQPYNFARTYEWREQTLQPGETIRPIDNSKVVRHQVKTTDGEGTLDTYFIPSHGENAQLANTTVIYNHGNYASIEHYMPRVQMLHEVGFNVVVWDYRGYGKSQPASRPTQEQFLSDGRQIRDEAIKWAPDPNKIVLYAYSLGGIPAMAMALHKPGCALLLETAFPSVRTLVRSASTANMPEGFFSEARFNNIEKIKSYKGPVLVMFGTLDDSFTVRAQRELHDNAPGPKEFWEIEGAKHGLSEGGIPEASFANYKQKLLSFLQSKAPSCLQP